MTRYNTVKVETRCTYHFHCRATKVPMPPETDDEDAEAASLNLVECMADGC